MGIFVNSWPVGIAGGLLVLPGLADLVGYGGAMMAVAGLALIGLALLAFYRAPGVAGVEPPKRARPRGAALGGVALAGMVWGLYNAALTIVFSFAPLLLVD
jgi:hypothetical protein